MGASPPEAPWKGLLHHSMGKKRDFKPSCRNGKDSFSLFSFFVFQIGIIWDYGLCSPRLRSLSATLPSTFRTPQRTRPCTHSLPFCISHLLPTLTNHGGGGRQGEHLGGHSKGRGEWFDGLMVPRAAVGFMELLMLPQSSGSCPHSGGCSPSTLPSPFCWRDVYQVNTTSVVPQSVLGTPEWLWELILLTGCPRMGIFQPALQEPLFPGV